MMTLTYGTLSITIRNPDFSNTESIESRRIQRKSRGGDLITYRDEQWPKTLIFGYKFVVLKQDDLYALENFIKQTLGKEITLQDYEGRTWTGIITTPNEEMSQPQRELYAAGFQFQTT